MAQHVTDSTGSQLAFVKPTARERETYSAETSVMERAWNGFGTFVRLAGAVAAVLLVSLVAALLTYFNGLSTGAITAITAAVVLVMGGILIPLAWRSTLRKDWVHRRHEMSCCVACGHILGAPMFRDIPDYIPHARAECPGCGGVWLFPTSAADQ